jgi:hypothetical protein
VVQGAGQRIEGIGRIHAVYRRGPRDFAPQTN